MNSTLSALAFPLIAIIVIVFMAGLSNKHTRRWVTRIVFGLAAIITPIGAYAILHFLQQFGF